jgi:hypothetical protein
MRESFSQQGTDKTIRLIRDRAAEFQIPYSHILIDEDGVGGGVVDQLTGVNGFMGGSSPIPTRTALRRQMLPTSAITTGACSPHPPFGRPDCFQQQTFALSRRGAFGDRMPDCLNCEQCFVSRIFGRRKVLSL